MLSDENLIQIASEKKKFDYFEYDRLISIDFGSTWTKFAYYDIRNEQLVLDNGKACSYHPSACLYSCKNNDYDNAVFKKWGTEAELKRRKLTNALYIDNLRDKVEYLFDIECDTKKPLQQAKDRLYQRAIIQYFKKFVEYIINFINLRDSRSDPSKNRYVMTYPSDWIPGQVSYLRSLAQSAGIVGEQDHPDRLIMYSEGASILRYAQEPHSQYKIKQGHRYLICDLGGSKVKMNLYNIKEPLDRRNNMKGESRCTWDISIMEEPSQLQIGAQNISKQCEMHVLSRLSQNSNIFKLEDVDEQDGHLFDRREEFGSLVDKIMKEMVKGFSKETITKNQSSVQPIPFSLQEQELESIILKIGGSIAPSSEKTLGRVVGKSMLTIYATELEENVFKPVCDKIIHYLEKIITRASDSIDAIILVGGFCHSVYLMDLIVDTCKRTSTKLFTPFIQSGSEFSSYEIVCGAIMKSMDKVEAHDPAPRIVIDKEYLHQHSMRGETEEVLVFIDYGPKDTSVSYIILPAEQSVDSADIKRIMDWPGQPAQISDFPTIDVMLFPSDESDPNSGKKIVSLRDNAKQAQERRSTYKYYTFERDEQGIILLTHCKAASEKKTIQILYGSVEELQIAQQNLNSSTDKKETDSVALINKPSLHRESLSQTYGTHRYIDKYEFTVTRQRISVQEFSVLYFDYLLAFLFDNIHLKTGIEKDRFRFCITRDNQADPDNFELSDEDVRKIANKCGLHSEGPGNQVLALERAEATAIYCRKMINRSDMDDQAAHLHFLQVQLYPHQCVMLLNRVPFLDEKDHNASEQDVWEGIYKCVVSNSTPFNYMDTVCENLWKHMQIYQYAMLKKCRRHRPLKHYFYSNNLKVFKKMIQFYVSTTFLDLKDGEKVHKIYICDNGLRNCCHMVITNMDILEFGMVPAINQLVSMIQGSIFNQCLYKGLQISDIFVLGEFLTCRDYTSYKFLEDLLLMKLRKINFRRLDNLMLHSMTKNTQVRKVRAQLQDSDDALDDELCWDSLKHISASGSLMYGLNPRDRLVERFASRLYAIRIQVSEPNGRVLNRIIEDDEEGVYVVYEHSSAPIKVTSEQLIPVIEKGTRLASTTSIGEEISKSFMIYNSLPNQKITIGLFTITGDDSSVLDYRILDSKFDQIQDFVIENCTHPTYPIIFKARVSQTKSYKFWVAYGKNERKSAINIRESILLKSYHSR